MSDQARFDGPLRIIGRGCRVIGSVHEWGKYAPPTGGIDKFKDNKSAKEAAKAWVGRAGKPKPPTELVSLLNSRGETGKMRFGLTVPEARLRFDRYRGNTRNSDLAIFGKASGGDSFIAIEAKAHEPFGQTIEKALQSKTALKDGSNLPKRINTLSRLFFGRPAERGKRVDNEIGQIQYQLLHGLAGTLFEAKEQGADQAIFVVHEFKPKSTSNGRSRQNANEAAFATFFKLLGIDGIAPGKLSEISLPKRRGLPSLPLFVGWITTPLPQPRAATKRKGASGRSRSAGPAPKRRQ